MSRDRARKVEAPEPSAAPAYDATFFEGNRQLAERAAKTIVGIVARALPVRSVVDFGCAEGVWLQAWRDAGVEDLVGLDGDYVDRSRFRLPTSCFRPADLAQPIDLGRRFDLAQSLEVAEHLPAEAAPGFVAAIVGHAPLALFSAAPPGQGGFNHVNEQPYEYWRDLFAQRQFVLFDWLRPKLSANRLLPPWYRFNTFLYAHESIVAQLPPDIRATQAPGDAPIADVSPLLYRLRKAVVRRLSPAAQNRLSHLKRRVLGRR